MEGEYSRRVAAQSKQGLQLHEEAVERCHSQVPRSGRATEALPRVPPELSVASALCYMALLYFVTDESVFHQVPSSPNSCGSTPKAPAWNFLGRM